MDHPTPDGTPAALTQRIDAAAAANDWKAVSQLVTLGVVLYSDAQADEGDCNRERADLFERLGVLSGQLGEREDGRAYLNRCVELRRKLLGDRHPSVFFAMRLLLTASARLSDSKDAEIRRLFNAVAPDHVAQLEGELQQVVSQRRMPLASRIAEEILESELLLHGDASVQYASSLTNLAFIEKEMGHMSSAEGRYLRAIGIMRRHEGRENSLQLAKVLNNAAQLMLAQGRAANAEPLFRDAVARMRAVVGADEEHFHDVVKELCAFNERTPSSSDDDGQTVAQVSEAVDRILTLGMLTANLATALYETNKRHESETLLAYAVALLRDLLGPEHPVVIQTLVRQAAHRHADQPDEAVEMIKSVVAGIERPRVDLTPLPELNVLFENLAGPAGVEISPSDLPEARLRCEREFCDEYFSDCFRTAMAIGAKEPSLEITQLMLLSMQYLDGPAGIPGARITPLAQMIVQVTAGSPWPNALLRLATGDAKVQDVLRDARDDSGRCQALFYASWRASLVGNMAESEGLHRDCVALESSILERRIAGAMGPPPRRARDPAQSVAIGLMAVHILALMRAGRPGEALDEAERAWQLAKNHLDPQDGAYQRALYLRGSVAVLLRDWDMADDMLSQLLKLLGPPGPRDVVARSGAMNSLALVRIERGQYAEATELLEKALHGLEGSESGGESRTNLMANVLGNLAEVKREQFDIELAVPLYDRAVALLPDKPGLAIDRARTLRNASAAYHAAGMDDEAARLAQMALAIYERDLPKGDVEIERTRLVLAAVDPDVGTPEVESTLLAAIERLRRAGHRSDARLASYLTQLAQIQSKSGANGDEALLVEAIEVFRREFGERHPHLGTLFLNLAVFHAVCGAHDLAVEAIRSAEPCEDLMLQNSFGMGSERRRMLVGQLLQRGMYLALALALHAPQSAIAAETAANLVFRRKAVTLELQATTRDRIFGGRFPHLQKELDQLLSRREQLANSLFVGAGAEGKVFHATFLADLQRECDQLEEALSQKMPEMQVELHTRSTVDCAQISAALPLGAVAIELVKQPVIDFTRLRDAHSDRRVSRHRYVAIVVRGGDSFPRLVDLGETSEVDQLLETFRESIEGAGTSAPGEAWRETGEVLRRHLFDPLLPYLEGQRKLFIATDGALCRAPFQILPTADGKFLLDDYEVVYVGTSRDVLRFDRTQKLRAMTPLVIGDPDFDLRDIDGTEFADAPGDVSGGIPSVVSRGMREATLVFERLPGTAREAKLVADLLGVSAVTGAEAVENRLLLARSPAVLHVATHGFYLDVDAGGALDAVGLHTKLAHIENPLHRSGLAFAGANSWLAGESLPPQVGDGIVTAADVTGLDLTATQLVVLAACETGLGRVSAGEGVFGLRRAFHIAGAATLVVALWKVPDAMTQRLMVNFYEKLRRGQGCADALRNAQLELKKESAHPFFWGAFICEGDPSALSASLASEGSTLQ